MFRSSHPRSFSRYLQSPHPHPLSLCSRQGTQSSCSRPAKRHRPLPLLAVILVGVWITGCSRPADPPVKSPTETERSSDVTSDDAPTAEDVASEPPDTPSSTTPDEPSPDEPSPAAREETSSAAHGEPSPASTDETRSLADALSQSPTPADEEAERATDEILAPLDESDEFRPDRRAAKAFGDPPHGVRLSQQSRLWVDRANRRVLTDGYVTLREGYLEMFACPTGTKEHESIVATLSKSSEVHAALLAVGATPGHPVRYDPEFEPPSGQSIRVWILWRDEAGEFQSVDARDWVRHAKSKEPLAEDWVFGGSDFWKDPADGREYYQADGGDMICVSNFGTAMLDVPFKSSADADDLLFVPFTERIPEIGTPVRMVLTPIAGPDAEADDRDPSADQPPGEESLPAAKSDTNTAAKSDTNTAAEPDTNTAAEPEGASGDSSTAEPDDSSRNGSKDVPSGDDDD